VRCVSEPVLDRCDRLIRRYRLHGNKMVGPVGVQGLLEAYGGAYRYGELPEGVQGFLMRWDNKGTKFVLMLLDERLQEIEEAAQRRYVIAHEMAHKLLGHAGVDLELMRTRGGGWALQTAFGEWVEGVQERECDYVAAYLLVPLRALREMEGMEDWYVASALDVPVEMVRLRWEIWTRWDR